MRAFSSDTSLTLPESLNMPSACNPKAYYETNTCPFVAGTQNYFE